MIVSVNDFYKTIAYLMDQDQYGLDTETYGLGREDRLFGISIAVFGSSYYFNWNNQPDYLGKAVHPDHILPKEFFQEMLPLFHQVNARWYIHNALFDLYKLHLEGINIAGRVVCTQTLARLHHNQQDSYTLDACAKRELGLEKDDKVMECIRENKLYTMSPVPGKKKREKNLHFDKVPFPIISEYALKDAQLHLELGKHYRTELFQRNHRIAINEVHLTKTLHSMEREGILIDRQYCVDQLEQENKNISIAKQKFFGLTGVDYGNGGRTMMKQAFNATNTPYAMTEKGNPCFDKNALEVIQGDLGDVIREIRFHEKMANTYYSSFLHLADKSGTIRANIKPHGTDTGRFSYSNPNLQNIPKAEDSESEANKVRRCFIPRPGFIFVMIDYDQQEFRMMLDHAGEMEAIKLVNEGMDVHEVTAGLMGVTRREAKTLNFGLLYGMGKARLAEALKTNIDEANKLKRDYFSRFPRVRRWLEHVMRKAERVAYYENWAGRRCYSPSGGGQGFKSHKESAPNYSYKIPNHIIQGGCADVIKIAMNNIHDFLQDKKSNMLITVHDELLFEIHESEKHIVDTLKTKMEEVYPSQNGMLLTCSVEYSEHNWADKKQWA